MEEGKRVSPSVPYGYYRNPKNKQELLVDKESSKVVKRIYRLVIEGYGVTQIADILTKDKVLIPSAYAQIHYPENNHSSKKRGIEDPYFWTPTTVGYILEKREYMGHTVLGKTICLDYKTKKRRKAKEYYLVVGRFVPENNFETMIKEFMKSNSKKNFAIITTSNDEFLKKLEEKLHFKNDPRIKFVGTVYDTELLKKIREQAYGYFHGHEVGGTNPSLLEALGSTDLNLLLNVGFNREVAEDAALYWDKAEGSLSQLVNNADLLSNQKLKELGLSAKSRIANSYSWSMIVRQYENTFNKQWYTGEQK